MIRTPNSIAPKAGSPVPASPPWLETQAKVTACHYEFARLNTLTLGFATNANRFRISYTYYAHARTFRDEFTSPVFLEQGKTFVVFYNPLNPQENRQSVSGAASISGTPVVALGIAGSIVISLLYLVMMRGCN